MEIEFDRDDVDTLLDMAEREGNRRIITLARLLLENSEVTILVEED